MEVHLAATSAEEHTMTARRFIIAIACLVALLPMSACTGASPTGIQGPCPDYSFRPCAQRQPWGPIRGREGG